MASTIDFEELAPIVNLSNKIIAVLTKLVKTIKIDKEHYNKDTLKALGFRTDEYDHRMRKWLIHPDLLKIEGVTAYQLSRYAMLVNMRQARDNKKDETTLSHLMYTTDKALFCSAVGLPENTFFRFDTFECTLDGTGGFRKNGTTKGSLMHKTQKRKTARESNKELLHILMYGDYNTQRSLVCAYSNSVVEDVKIGNSLLGTSGLANEYELHHPKFINRESSNKTESPSEYLNRYLLSKMPHGVIMELLNLIVLGASRHSSIHKFSTSEDISCWMSRYENGELAYLPFHWINEDNYKSTLGKIANLCNNFNPNKTLTYAEFIKFNSLNTTDAEIAVLAQKFTIIPESTYNMIFSITQSTESSPILDCVA